MIGIFSFFIFLFFNIFTIILQSPIAIITRKGKTLTIYQQLLQSTASSIYIINIYIYCKITCEGINKRIY